MKKHLPSQEELAVGRVFLSLYRVHSELGACCPFPCLPGLICNGNHAALMSVTSRLTWGLEDHGVWVRSGISFSQGGCELWLCPLILKYECSTFKPTLSCLGETHKVGFQQHGIGFSSTVRRSLTVTQSMPGKVARPLPPF